MSDAPENLPAPRRVPGWPRRWLVLFGLHDYLMGDAPILCDLWLRNRAAFWQYVMKVEESRVVDEAVRKGDACPVRQPRPAPSRGSWRIE